MAKVLISFVCAVFAWCGQAAEKSARIALLSDPHVTLKTNGAPAKYGAHFEKVIAAVNAAKVDMVLIAGDLANEGKLEEWRAFNGYIKKLQAPVFYVPGNHDVGHKFNSGKTVGTTTPERVADYEKIMGRSFFVEKRAGIKIIGLNSSLLGSGFSRETEQWNFLEKQLSKPARVPAIVFMHYPLFIKTADEEGGIYFNTEPEPRKRLLALLRRGGVKTVLTGHLHGTLVNREAGILFVSTEPISFGIPAGKQPEGWTLVTVPPDGEATFEIKNLE